MGLKQDIKVLLMENGIDIKDNHDLVEGLIKTSQPYIDKATGVGMKKAAQGFKSFNDDDDDSIENDSQMNLQQQLEEMEYERELENEIADLEYEIDELEYAQYEDENDEPLTAEQILENIEADKEYSELEKMGVTQENYEQVMTLKEHFEQNKPEGSDAKFNSTQHALETLGIKSVEQTTNPQSGQSINFGSAKGNVSDIGLDSKAGGVEAAFADLNPDLT